MDDNLPTTLAAGRSMHMSDVREFMRLAGQDTPEGPTIPSKEIRLLRARLILEEAIETIEALGFALRNADGLIGYDGITFSAEYRPNMVEILDGCADIFVVTTGTLAACGFTFDRALQMEVDRTNLAKFTVPFCAACGAKMELIGAGSGKVWQCLLAGATHAWLTDEGAGGRRREDGKWLKPTDWQKPRIQELLDAASIVASSTPQDAPGSRDPFTHTSGPLAADPRTRAQDGPNPGP